MHRPDPFTPIEEALEARTDPVVREGRGRHVGSSGLAARQVADAAWPARSRGPVPFVGAQHEYGLLDRRVETELRCAAERFGVGLLPYFPLAGGLPTGEYRRGTPRPPTAGTRPGGSATGSPTPGSTRWSGSPAHAAERSLSLRDVAVSALLARPAVGSVIAGVTSAAAAHREPTAGEPAALGESVPPGLRGP